MWDKRLVLSYKKRYRVFLYLVVCLFFYFSIFIVGNSDLASLLMTKTQTFSQQNVSAGAQLTVNEKVNTYDGYKCIGIVGYSTGHVFVECSTCEYQESPVNSIYMIARNNHSSTSLNVTPRATLLYQKII